MVFDDNSPLLVSRCGDVIIAAAKFGDVIHVPRVGLNLLFIHCITHQQKGEILTKLMGCKDMNGGFKVVASRYCDEYDHMYKLGKTPSLEQKGFVAMVANVDNANIPWHQHLGHTNFGSCDI